NIVLVGNIADDLLQDVLERNKAHELAVLVDDKRERRLPAPKCLDLLGQRPDVRYEPRRPGELDYVDLTEVSVTVLNRTRQDVGVEYADDVLSLAAPQRNARDRLGEDGLDHLLRRIVDAHGDHIGPMDHDIGHHEVAQVEQPTEHVTVELFDAAL